ncbi:MAG: penicillin-binding protein activator [Desulfobacula sp.]
MEKEKPVYEPPKSVEEQEEKLLSKPSVIQVLSIEAEKFVSQRNYTDALSIYDQILLNVKEDKKFEIILKIESVLAKAPTEILENLDKQKDIKIPESLIIYYLGLKHAMENNPYKSKEYLETYLSRYPDHYHYYEALELLDVVKKSLFTRDTIGCLLPLTGKFAVFGQRALAGVQLAVQELSKKYSIEFKVIVIDTQADPEITVEGVKKLNQKNVAGILGPLLMEDEAGKEAEKLKIPMIALTQKNDFTLQGDYLFANFITPEMQVQALGNHVFSDLGIKKAAILYPNEKYGIKYMELFHKIAEEYKCEIVGFESYDGKKNDLTVPIRKITEKLFPDSKSIKSEINFQALFIPDSPARVNLILSQLGFNDTKNVYFIGTNLWHDESLLKATKGSNRNIIISDGFLDSSRNPIVDEFTKNFESLFNHKPQFLEAISFDTTSILFITAMDKTVDSREALKDALKGKRIYDGVTGQTMFDQQGIAHRPLFLMTIKNGEFVEINR